MLDNITIILVNPVHPRNIGSAARAIKNMGLNKLILVNPSDLQNNELRQMASSAGNIIDNAVIVDSLDKALANINFAFATSSRSMSMPWPVFNVKEAAQYTEKLLTENPIENFNIAIVFGTERIGLTNDEVQLCDAQLQIPASKVYPVLNLAQALQVITYEFFQHLADLDYHQDKSIEVEEVLATGKQKDNFMQHLIEFSDQIGFLSKRKNSSLIPRLKRIFAKAKLENKEINILRGILTTAEKRINDKNSK